MENKELIKRIEGTTSLVEFYKLKSEILGELKKKKPSKEE